MMLRFRVRGLLQRGRGFTSLCNQRVYNRCDSRTYRGIPEGRGHGRAISGLPAASHISPWDAFCDRWNVALARDPAPVVIIFGGATVLTWAAIFGTLSMIPAAHGALAAPEFAVGWLAMRGTSRLRMPLQALLAAWVSLLFPTLSKLKVSPLLTVFVADTETKAHLHRLVQSPRLNKRAQQALERSFDGFGRFVRWAEGPVDKFGLAYYLTARATGLAALSGATAAALHGLDLPAILSSWGFPSALQSDAGLFACAAALNTFCVPLHFYGTVSTIAILDRQASLLWQVKEQELQDIWRETASRVALDDGADVEVKPLTEEDVQAKVVSRASFLFLVVQLGVSVFIFRRMSKDLTESPNSSAPDLGKVSKDGSSESQTDA